MNYPKQRLRGLVFIATVNLVIFIVLLGALELGARAFERASQVRSNNEQHALRFFWTMYRPFVMFTATPLQNRMFVNLYKGGPEGEKFVGKFGLNSDGFV